jgi:hypothetical protein
MRSSAGATRRYLPRGSSCRWRADGDRNNERLSITVGARAHRREPRCVERIDEITRTWRRRCENHASHGHFFGRQRDFSSNGARLRMRRTTGGLECGITVQVRNPAGVFPVGARVDFVPSGAGNSFNWLRSNRGMGDRSIFGVRSDFFSVRLVLLPPCDIVVFVQIHLPDV